MTPTVSAPASGRIAFATYGDDRIYRLYTVEAQGGEPFLISEAASQPSFSPDGTEIAFHSWRSDEEGIRRIKVDGSEEVEVSGFAEDINPHWSSDGKTIVFASNRAGDRRWRVYLVWLGAEDEAVELSLGRAPAWSPDGRIAYWGCNPQGGDCGPLDLDVGERDLQQCADAIIRLRAEYLWAAGRRDDIHFSFTSGDRADYARWREGGRPVVRGETVTWVRSAGRDDSYACFRAYLDTVFTYAGTYSLSQELSPVLDAADMQIGDVFIRGGFPGHAVVAVNMAAHRGTGERVFLLAQSYIPAQDIHVLRNPADADLSPWYSLDFGEVLRTPEYTFRRNELRRF